MDHKFYRMTDTEAEASEVTLVEATKRFQVVGDHMTALEVSSRGGATEKEQLDRGWNWEFLDDVNERDQNR